MFVDAALLMPLAEGVRVTSAFLMALALAALSWMFASRTFAGYRMLVAGLAPAAAAYAGFSEKKKHLARAAARRGRGRDCRHLRGRRADRPTAAGYLSGLWIRGDHRRLRRATASASGIVLASLLMSLLYLGGESVQLTLQLPSAVTGLFQGTLLFYLLAADLFVATRCGPHAASRSDSRRRSPPAVPPPA